MRRPSLNSARSGRSWALLVAAAIALSHAPLVAHDLWIEPTTFSPAAGQIVGVRLRVGQDLLGDPLPLDPALVKQFVAEEGDGQKPLVHRAGGDPAGLWRISRPGLVMLGYRSNPTALEQSAEKFSQYLKEEGLEAIAAPRAAGQGPGITVRELFARCAKSLVWSGPPAAAASLPSAAFTRPLGFTLELVPERNPYAVARGQELPVRLTYDNRPLAGALVTAISQLNPADKLMARSDASGRVRFRLPSGGMWLIKAVHMVPAPAGSNAEWTSFWASLTFELKSPASAN